MRNLAIIPARSGSKGLKDKNIRPVLGRPLLAYTIEAALDSHMFSEIMVSTDSGIYAELAVKYGAKVPFLRSEKTSGDKASSWDTVREVLDNYREIGESFDTFCLLQPTSPLRDSADIRRAYDTFTKWNSTAVVAVCQAEHPPQWYGRLGENGSMDDFVQEDDEVYQRQQCEPYYRVNGAIYIRDVKDFLYDGRLYKKGSFAYIMEQEKSIDIDTEMDFVYAETLMANKSLGGGITQSKIFRVFPYCMVRRCA